MNSIERAKKLIETQDRLNTETFKTKDWVKLGRPWYRAIWSECAELLDYYDWKWWKSAPEFYRSQVVLELVDILHFGISDAIQSGEEYRVIRRLFSYADSYSKYHAKSIPKMDPAGSIEIFAKETFKENRFCSESYICLILDLGVSFEEIYTLYFAKNALNLFRQENGYKEGHYIKLWADGKEDNWHLARIVSQLNDNGISEEDFEHELRSHLGWEYRAINELG